MELWQIISGFLTGLISVSMLVYVFFTSKGKGPILSNTYLLATDEERKNLNKSAEYHLVTVVFGILGMIFLMLTIRILTQWSWMSYIIGILIAILIFYAIFESIKSERRNE